MKKIILNMLLLFGITAAVAAQATDPVPMANTVSTQPENNAMLYNTPVNPYCTELYKSYWVWDKTAVAWVQRVELVAPCPYVPNAMPPEKTATTNQGAVVIKPKPGN